MGQLSRLAEQLERLEKQRDAIIEEKLLPCLFCGEPATFAGYIITICDECKIFWHTDMSD